MCAGIRCKRSIDESYDAPGGDTSASSQYIGIMKSDSTVFHQTTPFVVPTGDGKLIEEHFGLASTGEDALSIAHMVAPPGWSEPPQTPEFGEFTLVSRGQKQAALGDRTIVLEPGHSLFVPPGVTVQYSNPFDEEVEYWSVCMPAFSPERVNRES